MENGKIIKSTVKEKKLNQKAQYKRDSLKMGIKMVQESIK